MTLARTPYARLSPADIGQVDRELKKLEQMSAGLYVPKVLVAARSPYAVLATDTMLLCDCTAGPITLTFPLAARVDGMAVVVIKSDTTTNAVTLSGTFSGVVNPTIAVQDSGFTIVAMNGAYHVTAFIPYPIVTGESGVVSFVYPYGDVRRYGATGVAGTDARAAFAAADAAAIAGYGGNTAVHVPAGTHRIASNLSITSVVSFEGGVVKPDNGVTVTFNGWLQSALVKIFDLSSGGVVAFARGAAPIVSPKWWGAKEDSVTDDTTPAQQCAAAAVFGSTVRITGILLISASLAPTQPVYFEGHGATDQPQSTRAKIVGSFADYLVKVTRISGIVFGAGIRDIDLVNGDPAGGGYTADNIGAPLTVQNCKITAWRCITFDANTFTVRVDNCRIIGATFSGALASTTGGWGVYAASHCHIVECDITNHDNGVRMAVAGNIFGGRIEVNRTGVVLGQDLNGNAAQISGGALVGVTFEANDTAINTIALAAFDITGVAITGSVNAPSGQSIYGVRLNSGTAVSVRNMLLTGTYSKTAFEVNVAGAVFESVLPSNTFTGAKNWDVKTPETCVFIRCNWDIKADGVPGVSSFHSLPVRSLQKLDHMRGVLQGKNLRGFDVTVASAATFLDVTFAGALNSGQAQINTATAVNDVTSTLTAGTYFLVASLVTENGESQVQSEKTLTIVSAQRIDVTFFGVGGSGYRRRVYLGTATGVYSGYFESPINSGATLSILNTTYTGLKSPVVTTSTDCTEPDANYSVTVAPQWNTATWISNKTTTGFRVNFATAPGTTTALDWHILR